MRWWTQYGGEVERIFKGESWTCAERLKGVINWIEAVDEPGLSTKPGRIHTGLHSGYQAIGWVYHQGAARIILLGYDMQRGPKGESHHHGDHEGGLPNLGTLPEWTRRMVQLGIDLRTQGVEVINATRRTAVTCFEQMSIEKALSKPPRKSVVPLIPRELLPREYEAFAAGIVSARADITVIWGGRPPKPYPNGTVLVAENGYLDGPDGPYIALALGGHNGAGRWPQGSRERFERLGVAVRRWREKGGHVLVCPSRGIGANPMPKGWTEKTVSRLKQLTDREIRVRPHPGNWKKLPEHPDVSLRRDLEGAWCSVIWSSAAGIRSLAMGIPVLCDSPFWICKPCTGTIDEVENPSMPDRMPVFHRLASAQFSLDEIASGEPLRALMELAQEQEQMAA